MMSSDSNANPLPTPLSQRLRSEIAAYTVGHYSLLADLSHLQGVRQAGATEATIFYCARILEVLAAQAVQTMGLTPSSSSFSNIESLAQFNLMPVTTLYWANALRRLGNDVRHILRPTDPREADLAALFAERWVDWFFCRFRLGLRLPSVTVDAMPILPGNDPALPPLLRAIDEEDFDPAAWLPERWSGGEPPYMAASTIAAVIANLLLDRGETDAAFAVLNPARQRFPQDLRLAQLIVFGFKRRGELEKAMESAKPLLAGSRDDDETAGIVAGIYKQVYLDRGRDPEILAKSYRAYLVGWEDSKSSNAYLGINAAALALWMGRPADSRRLAHEVKLLLLKRIEALAARQQQNHLTISYWDEVTLAEAQLLLGEWSAAKARYQTAFAGSAKAKGNIKVTTDQADRHLAPLGLTITTKEFFADAVPDNSTTTITLGVTGHRTLVEDDLLKSRVNEAIETFQRMAAHGGGPSRLLLLSSLAAGADCLVAEEVLGKTGGALRVVSPMELAEYCRDFSPVELARFQSLLNRAESLVFTSPPPPKQRRGKDPIAVATLQHDREAAYELAGFYVVDQCQALIALWDGKPARGRGGTAEIVAYARKAGKKVIWINTQEPYEIVVDP